MTTKAPTAAVADETPRKRQRVEADSLSGGVPSLENVNDHCMLEILTFLEAEDLNSVAICSRRCREARSSPSLDQTRTGTIICTHNSSILGIYNAISGGGWNNDLYSGNRTPLRVVGLESVVERSTYVADIQRVQLTDVTSLDLSYSHHGSDRRVLHTPCYSLALILPNLRELDLSYMHTGIQQFCKSCPHLTRLIWNGADCSLFLDGHEFRDAANLAEVYMDGAQFYSSLDEHTYWADEPTDGGPNFHMYMYCKRLERLSIKT